MKRKNLIIVCICICATLLIAGVLFWPTLYRYDKTTYGGHSILIRINRLTGYTERFIGGKWYPERGHEKKEKKKKEIQRLPANEQAKITGKAGLTKSGLFGAQIYNGSDWTVWQLIFRVVAKEEDGSIRWDRKFKRSITIDPLSAKSFYIGQTGDEGVPYFYWNIEEALGYKVK